MRAQFLVVTAAVGVLVGCDKPAAPRRAPLVDLTTATSLEAVRTAFDAHVGEVRFLTLLSPT